MKEGKKIIHYAAGSVSSSCIDFIVFAITLRLGSPLLFCFVASRSVSFFYSFVVNKYWVFHAPFQSVKQLKRYSLLVAFSMGCAYALTRMLLKVFVIKHLYAKAIAEVSLFFINFMIQNRCIFIRSDQDGKN